MNDMPKRLHASKYAEKPEPVAFRSTDAQIQACISAWDGDITEQQARYLLEINHWKSQCKSLTVALAEALKENDNE